MDPQLLDYVERHSEANMADRVAVAEAIQREANITLAFFLTGAGAALAFSASSLAEGKSGSATGAALVTSVYLFILALALVWRCLWLREYPARHPEPKNLLPFVGSLDELRAQQVERLQERITEAAAINIRRADNLNILRIAAVATPLISWAAWGCLA